MAAVLEGETDEVGRFQVLERRLEGQKGIKDIHLRNDRGYLELCVHYDPEVSSFEALVAHIKEVGKDVSKRYRVQRWFVRGMDSAQCAYHIEFALNRTKGVLEANVAYAAERVVVEFDGEVIKPAAIVQKIETLGFDVEEPEAGHACCAHAHAGGLAPKLEIPLSIAAGALLFLGLSLEKLLPGSQVPALVPTVLYGMAAALAGFFPVRGALTALRLKQVDIETLMVLAAVGSCFLKAFFEAGLLLFLFSLGHALEHRALDRARRAIDALGKLRPETARVRREGAIVEVPVPEVKRGDMIVVRAGDRVPLDGVIKEGRSSLDQATVTGESVPVSKGPGEQVFAGTINTEAVLEVEVTKLSSESAIAKVIDLVTQAEAQKSKTQRFTKKLEQRFVPIVMVASPALGVALFALGHTLQESFLRAMSLLVAASPCALAISTPAAVLSAVARAARGGVLMKGGLHLETLGNIKSVAFDKTGTLTMGKPRLVSVAPAEGVDEATLLGTAAAVEALSSHPLAQAVVKGAQEKGVAFTPAPGCETVHGKGLRSMVDGKAVAIGSLDLFAEAKVPDGVVKDVERLQEAGQTTMVVRRGRDWLGVLGVADTLRPESKATLQALRAMGVTRTVMLSGDNARVARAIAREVGIDDPRAPLMPEGKVSALKELAREGGVAMVGDGVNDAPALAAASVGIAMGGAGSDVALETADVVLMGDDLRKLPFAVGLARQATAVVRQNLVISLGVSGVLVIATIFGWVRIAHAVVLHEGSTMVVVLNGLRLLLYAL
ncbi:MAG: cadmium-translocating P-type ATPase [Deltaproteobacteria bacterium]|nr:cadmium-translocating P-type ATPase [Deltaproteobacteria bacterium]